MARGNSITGYWKTVKEEVTPGKIKTRRVRMYLARVRVQDDKGIRREVSRAFDNPNDAKIYISEQTSEIKLGDAGKKIKRNKLMGGTKLYQLIQQRIQDLAFQKERNLRRQPIEHGSDIIGILQRFLRTEPTIVNKAVGDLDKSDFDDYRQRRVDDGVEDSTVNKYLSPIRKMFHLARDGELGGDFKGIRFDLDPTMIKFAEENNSRQKWLKSLEDDQQIYNAIERQCQNDLLRRRWLTFVVLALSTGLRKGVMLHLKWEDVDLKTHVIRVKREYRDDNKPAPPYVPISKNLHHHLSAYSNIVAMKKPTDRLFPYTPFGCQSYWKRIIRRTTLIFGKTKSGEPDYFSIHGFRHTAASRYFKEPYVMQPQLFGYLLGHRGLRDEDRLTKIQEVYHHLSDQEHREMCGKIRKAIDDGDKALVAQLKKQKKRRPDLEASATAFHDAVVNKNKDAALTEDQLEMLKEMVANPPSDVIRTTLLSPQQQVMEFKPRKPRTEKVKLKPRNPNFSLR